MLLVGTIVPLFYYVSECLWSRPLEWKDKYITHWTKTKTAWLNRGVVECLCYSVFGIVTYQASAILNNDVIFGVMVSVFAFLSVRLSLLGLYMVMVLLARMAYSGNPNFSFFLDMRLKLRKIALFLFLIAYFPIAKELLTHLAQPAAEDFMVDVDPSNATAVAEAVAAAVAAAEAVVEVPLGVKITAAIFFALYVVITPILLYHLFGLHRKFASTPFCLRLSNKLLHMFLSGMSR